MLTEKQARELEYFAEKVRLNTLKSFRKLGFGHVGGSLSIVEALAVLYGVSMRYKPDLPEWEDRDWLVFSKGHSGPALYATLALKGFFPVETLSTLNQPGTNLPSHCDRNKTAGVDMTTGSLGQGISTAIGIALGNMLDKRDNYTYLILGDGECNEGQIWEGVLFAAHNNVGNLIALIDYNKQQLDGYTRDILDLGNLSQKFSCFGWQSFDVNGHDLSDINGAIEKAKEDQVNPSAIILHTQKGKGCTFAEGVLNNHHMSFTEAQIDEAIECVKLRLKHLELNIDNHDA